MAIEAHRGLPLGKEGVHYPKFEAIIDLLAHFNLPSNLFKSEYESMDVLAAQTMVDKGALLLGQLADKILESPPDSETLTLLDAAYDYLSEEDDNTKKAEAIFVFGSKTPARIEKAIELYKASFAPKLVISGGAPFYGSDHPQSEGDRYREVALNAGVPANAIFVENKSVTLPDNIRTTLNIFDEQGISYKSYILVNSPYVQRRGWAVFKKYLPDGVSLIRVNSETADVYGRAQWFKSEQGIKTILNEFVKLKVAIILETA
jgi:uncharacterized SAM-binding protein YcdF (DUF218 family)